MSRDCKRWMLGITLGIFLVGLFATLRLAAQAGSTQEPFRGDPQNPLRVDGTRGPVDLGLTDPALVGAIDIHEHLAPAPRFTNQRMSIDVFDAAKLAKSRGMRGFVFKSHLDASSALAAYLVRTHLDPTIEVFGRMPLNFPVGGINVAAVEAFAQVQGGWGRIVEMPTMDGPCPCPPDVSGRPEFATPDFMSKNRRWAFLMPPDSPKFVPVSKNGELLPEVKRLIGVMAKILTVDSNAPLVLGTGHISGEETLLVAREARKVGLQVTSPHGATDMNATQLQEYLKLGGFVELRQNGPRAELVRKIGAEQIIASTDCGFLTNPFPPDCLAVMARQLRAQGVTERELDLMFKENPAKLLGLPPWRGSAPATAAVRP
jgi:Family of unknown function (DUF6282)